MLTGSFETDCRILDNLLEPDASLRKRDLLIGGRARCRVLFSDGRASQQLIADSVVKPLLSWRGPLPERGVPDLLRESVLEAPEVKTSESPREWTASLRCGDALLLIEGERSCLIVGARSFAFRAVSEPEDEKVARGPREGFVEPLMVNLSLLRRRLQSRRLRTELVTVGGTACALCWIEGTADESVLAELRARLERADPDAVLDANHVLELIADAPFGLFRRVGSTARPDAAAAKLLEGRVAVVVDGSPQVLTAPFVFLEHFQSPEDYYTPWHSALTARLLRLAGFFIAVTLVPVYVAVINYHPGMLSTRMICALALAQEATPFSAVTEAALLLLAFDLLREAGMRTPAAIGQTLSIVGALILGQSAVEAQVASPPMVVLVALSGVTGLIVTELRDQIVLLRFPLLVLAELAGLWGCVMGLMLIGARLASIRSFGVDYLSSMPFVRQGSHEDSLLRVSMRFMKRRRFLAGGPR